MNLILIFLKNLFYTETVSFSLKIKKKQHREFFPYWVLWFQELIFLYLNDADYKSDVWKVFKLSSRTSRIMINEWQYILSE